MRRDRSLLDRVGRAEAIGLLAFVPAMALPLAATDAAMISLLTQVMVAAMGAFSVYIMLRMDLLSFATPAFMAVGGYAVAILGVRHEVTDLFVLTAVAFALPFLLAIPLGLLILRLRGVYFVLVSFVIAQIVPLLLFETPQLTGGANGISGLPPVTVLGGYVIEDNNATLLMITGLGLVSTLMTALVTRTLRAQFDSISENELLAQSLGLAAARYKILGFCFAGGVAGLGGFGLSEMLITAHPSSFAAMSSVNYVAYVIVGGRSLILGPLCGAALLVSASNLFSMQGVISQGLFGVLLMLSVLFARGGIVGALRTLLSKRPSAKTRGRPAAQPEEFT